MGNINPQIDFPKSSIWKEGKQFGLLSEYRTQLNLFGPSVLVLFVLEFHCGLQNNSSKDGNTISRKDPEKVEPHFEDFEIFFGSFGSLCFF